jgi:hypothetical protein
MLKFLVALGLGAAILLQASAFVATKSGGFERDAMASGPAGQTQLVRLGPTSGPVRLLP